MKKILIVIFFLFLPIVGSAQDFNLSSFIQYTGENADDAAGHNLVNAGDVNNDGYQDFLVSAFVNDEGGIDAGAVYLFYGSANVLSSLDLAQADVKFIGEETLNYAGQDVSAAGDINHDGYDDILIGAQSANVNGTVYLVYGSNSLASTFDLADANVKFIGATSSDKAGRTLSYAGDVNGDGIDDILIGADNKTHTFSEAGSVYLVYGGQTFGSTFSLASANVEIKGQGDEENLGKAVASGGDINGDGYDDIVLFSNIESGFLGAVYVIYGGSNLPAEIIASSAADAKFIGESNSDKAGEQLALGDVNNDGYYDLIIGVTGEDTSLNNTGAVYLVYGQSEKFTGSATLNNTNVDVKIYGEAADDGLPNSLDSQDVNYDGYDDVLIGAPGYDGVGLNAGATYLVFGSNAFSSSISVANADLRFMGKTAGDQSATAVALTDCNGDNYYDVLIGANAAAYGGSGAGAAYLGYIYVDNDHDGLAGTDGLLDGTDPNDNDHDNDGSETGTDCNDDDPTVFTNQTYYQDSDGDTMGNINVSTSVCSSTPPSGYANNTNDPDDTIRQHPLYYANNVNEDDNLRKVEGYKNGQIKVTYDDNSVYYFNVFSLTTDKLTKVKQYKQTGYYLVLQPKAKKLAIINSYTGEVLSRKVLSKKVKYQYNSLKLFTLRNKKWATITAKTKKGKVKLSLVRIKINEEKLAKKVYATLQNKKVKPSKTKRNKNTVLLRNKNNKILNKYLLTKKLILKEI